MSRGRELDDISKEIVKAMVRVRATQNFTSALGSSSLEPLTKLSTGVDCDEVYNNIFIGDVGAALNKGFLKKLGITHVVNAAEGNALGMVNTNPKYYAGTGIKYLGLHLMDLSCANISVHFYNVADFIEEGLACGGKVLVHCYMGVSRSGTLVLAYLMIKHGMRASDAMSLVRHRRNIHPNEGFIRQLAALENRLGRIIQII